jgi:hypothetical protein
MEREMHLTVVELDTAQLWRAELLRPQSLRAAAVCLAAHSMLPQPRSSRTELAERVRLQFEPARMLLSEASE